MSYQVLARKWRPKNFHELVGQDHVRKALVSALDNNRLHHAYLFTGTRGVGKTTIARIISKCLNCETGITSRPCGECTSCREIDEGRFVDLIEVDAASRTKVEDTRELLDNVQYAPSRGRFKVYLIDEVHMLSTHSFNALLKTLEEPPPHVKFLLATTDPQKLPVTVLSRCLQFNLKNMPPERVVEHLNNVLTQEQIPFDDAALWQLGRAADGSMRDALSLTDQAIAYGQGSIEASQVSEMLGLVDHRHVAQLIDHLINQDAAAMLGEAARLSEQAADFETILADMALYLHRMAIAQLLPDAVDNAQGDREQVINHAACMSAEDLQLYYQIAIKSQEDLPLAPDMRTGFEMAMIRMLAFAPQGVPVSQSNTSGATSSGNGVSPGAALSARLAEGKKKAALTQPSAPVNTGSDAQAAQAQVTPPQVTAPQVTQTQTTPVQTTQAQTVPVETVPPVQTEQPVQQPTAQMTPSAAPAQAEQPQPVQPAVQTAEPESQIPTQPSQPAQVQTQPIQSESAPAQSPQAPNHGDDAGLRMANFPGMAPAPVEAPTTQPTAIPTTAPITSPTESAPAAAPEAQVAESPAAINPMDVPPWEDLPVVPETAAEELTTVNSAPAQETVEQAATPGPDSMPESAQAQATQEAVQEVRQEVRQEAAQTLTALETTPVTTPEITAAEIGTPEIETPEIETPVIDAPVTESTPVAHHAPVMNEPPVEPAPTFDQAQVMDQGPALDQAPAPEYPGMDQIPAPEYQQMMPEPMPEPVSAPEPAFQEPALQEPVAQQAPVVPPALLEQNSDSGITPLVGPCPPQLDDNNDWLGVFPHLALNGLERTLAQNSALTLKEGDTLHFNTQLVRQEFVTPERINSWQQAIMQLFNQPIRIEIQQTRTHIETPAMREEQLKALRKHQAQQIFMQDDHILRLVNEMGAEINMESVEPLI